MRSDKLIICCHYLTMLFYYRTNSLRLSSSPNFLQKNTTANNKDRNVNTPVKTPTTMKHANTNVCPTDTHTAWMKIKAETMATTRTATTKLSSILKRLLSAVDWRWIRRLFNTTCTTTEGTGSTNSTAMARWVFMLVLIAQLTERRLCLVSHII